MRPTTTGVVVAVAAPLSYVVGWWLGQPALVALSLALAGALAVSAAVVSRRPRLDVRRELGSRRAVAGQPATAALRVTNTGRRTSPPSVVTEPVGTTVAQLAVPRLAPGEQVVVTHALPTSRRAVLTLGPSQLRRDDPFGLLTWSQELSGTDTFWVHPATVPLPPLPSGRRRDLEGPASNRAMQGTAQFHSLREFVPGDDRRHIHWRSSARKGTYMVVEHVDVTRPKATVVLDVGAAYGPDAFDVAVAVAASILVSTIDRGFPVRLLATDGTTYEEEQRPDARLLLDACAGLQPVADAPLSAAATWLARDRTGSTLTVVTGEAEPARLASLRPLAARYDGVSVIRVTDPSTPGTRVAGFPVLDVARVEDVRRAWLGGVLA